MHIWAKRDFRDRTYLYALDQIAEQQLTLGAAADLMMVRTPRSDRAEITTVLIRLPNPSLIAAYEGFVQISDHDLPNEAVLLFGDLGEFQKLFKNPPL
jgi:hypothetical protein